MVAHTETGYHFRVDEKFRGVKRDYIDVETLVVEGSTGFSGLNKQYLVFANTQKLNDGNHLFVSGCGRNLIELTYARALLDQLRREKGGKRIASVYGMLVRTMAPDIGIWDENYTRPLPGIVVRFQSLDRTFETTTNAYGAYAFDQLPTGSYRISADLPRNLEVAQRILDDPLPPVQVKSGSCYEQEIDVLPTGRISGQVIGPDSTPRVSTSVSLFRAEQYTDVASGAFGYQGGSKPFEFLRLPPGDYVLVFGSVRNRIDPDNPFPRTFYPSAPDIPAAHVIHLSDGQQILNADIHLPAALPTRKLFVHLLWNGRRPADYYTPNVIVETEGQRPHPEETAENTYSLNLLLDATYRVHVRAFCRSGPIGLAETDGVTVQGGDTSVSDLTLAFRPGACPQK